MNTAAQESFRNLLRPIAALIAGRALDAALQRDLNGAFPGEGAVVAAIRDACLDAIAAGWMCQRSAGGIAYGRVFQPSSELADLSVDVVRMKDVVGPHHRHPNGEIDLNLPLSAAARFDGHPAGWVVYGPESAHRPTVSAGEALVVYLLPQGAIEFTGLK